MTKHETEILNLLLNRYERSGHCLPGKTTNRPVSLSLTRGEYSPYRENDPCVMDLNRVIFALAEDGMISYTWRKGYEDWLLDKVLLNLEALPQVYERVHRTPLADTADALLQLLCQTKERVHTEWKLRFIEDELCRIEKTLHPSRLLPEDVKRSGELMKVLAYTERGPELMRVISTNCFHDSKFLEKHLRPQLCSIAKAYEPDLIAYRTIGEDILTQNVVLGQLGVLPAPEVFEFSGAARLIFSETTFCTLPFQKGFCLQSENLEFISEITLEGIHSVLFVENRTNYRSILSHGVPDEQLVIFHGGFYSPGKKRFFHALSRSISHEANVQFWGDIDLGGFLMFTRLKRELFPMLTPYRMGLEDYSDYKQYGITRDGPYLTSLQQNMEENAFDPIFFPITKEILKFGVTVEQEIML